MLASVVLARAGVYGLFRALGEGSRIGAVAVALGAGSLTAVAV